MLLSRSMTKYVLGELVGRGGMGQVHSARDPSGRAVVVKRLRNTLAGNLSMADRLNDEARLLGQVAHHNVVRVVDRGNDDSGAPYLVMDHVAGISLAKLIDRDGPLPVQRALSIASQLVAGLAAIHDAGVVHADMKSSNLLIDDNDRVMIIDFGLARAVTVEMAQSGMVMGTPAFMAPEVIGGAAPTVASDIYGVGAILYEMLTGVTPFAYAQDIFSAHLQEPVIPPSLRAPSSGISLGLDRLVARTLAKKPEQRHATVRELGAALDQVVAADFMMATIQACTLEDRRTLEFHGRQLADLITRAPTEKCEPKQPDEREQIAVALERARALIEGDDANGAVVVLEAALAALSPDVDSDAVITAEAWRIETVLAALYHGLGRKERARRVALTACKHAARTGCKTAVARAQALIDKLDRQRGSREIPKIPTVTKLPARLAKGSAQFRRYRR